jgi:hypothetical protein
MSCTSAADAPSMVNSTVSSLRILAGSTAQDRAAWLVQNVAAVSAWAVALGAGAGTSRQCSFFARAAVAVPVVVVVALDLLPRAAKAVLVGAVAAASDTCLVGVSSGRLAAASFIAAAASATPAAASAAVTEAAPGRLGRRRSSTAAIWPRVGERKPPAPAVARSRRSATGDFNDMKSLGGCRATAGAVSSAGSSPSARIRAATAGCGTPSESMRRKRATAAASSVAAGPASAAGAVAADWTLT